VRLEAVPRARARPRHRAGARSSLGSFARASADAPRP
jgi:hypothetical protein